MTRKQVLIIIAAVAVCAIPTTATAHGGNNDPDVIHACIGNVSKVVRIVGVSGACLSSPPLVAETPVHWSTHGPQGLQGLQGIQGPQGPQGAPGTNGINGVDGEDGTNGTPAAPPCFDNTNRYIDCGNGTVTDTNSGLIWLLNADCLGSGDWAAANSAAAALADGQCGLTDGSAAGDWRLPTRDEWRTTISDAVARSCTGQFGAPPALTDDGAQGCLSSGSSSFLGVPVDPTNEFSNVVSFSYWSSTGAQTSFPDAWYVDLYWGGTATSRKGTSSFRIWPVRGGSR